VAGRIDYEYYCDIRVDRGNIREKASGLAMAEM